MRRLCCVYVCVCVREYLCVLLLGLLLIHIFESLPYRHSTQINLYAFCLSLSVRAAATAAAASARLSSLWRIYKMHIFCLCFFDWQRHMCDILYTALHLCVCACVCVPRRVVSAQYRSILSHRTLNPKAAKKCACAIGERHLMMMLLLLPRLLLLPAADAALWLRLQFCALLLLAH